MRIAFFEDDGADGFAPIALTRPVFELVCGQFSLRERLVRFLDVQEWGVFIRPYLEASYREFSPEAFVNDCVWLGEEPTLMINARWLPTPEAIEQLSSIESNVAGFCGDTLAFLLVEPFESSLLSDSEWAEPLLKIAGTRNAIQAEGKVVSHPWNLIDFNPEQLEADFRSCAFTGGQTDFGPQIAVLGAPENVYVSLKADIDPFVVIDARSRRAAVGCDGQIIEALDTVGAQPAAVSRAELVVECVRRVIIIDAALGRFRNICVERQERG